MSIWLNSNGWNAIAQLSKVCWQYGYEGATLARLSAATGLGTSLYHHFPKAKEEMAAVLNQKQQWFEEHLPGELLKS